MDSLRPNVHVSARLTKSHAFRVGRKDLVLGSEHEDYPDHGQFFLKTVSSGITEGSEEFVVGTPAGCVVCRTVKSRGRSGLFQQHLWNTQDTGARGRTTRTQRVKRRTVASLCTYVRPVHADLPPISTEPAMPRRVYIRNSVELARCGYTLGCTGC